MLFTLWGMSGCANVDAPQGSEEVARRIGAVGGDNLVGTNLSGANLGGTNLSGANLGGTNLSGVNLGGVNLGGVNLSGTNLGGTNLGGTNLAGNNLGANNLSGNNLGGVNLGGVNLGGVNLGGVNLGGVNLSGTNLSGSNVAGTYAGLGCPVNGTQHLGTDLSSSTVGVDIHNLGASVVDEMLRSGEDVFTRTQACVVLGIGSTAMAKLLSQNSADTTMYAALRQLPWGFATEANGPVALSAWEVLVWGSRRYSVFVLAAPPAETYSGVAGFIKAVWRWAAPPSATLKIGQIGGGQPVASYTGMMDAAANLDAGAITEKAYVAGELALITATTNNQTVTVDFASWVRRNDGTGLMLSNVETPDSPTYGEAVYRALEEPDGTIRIGVGPIRLAGGLIDSMSELKAAYMDWAAGLRPDKPIPRRCAGALLLNSLNNAESDWKNKCDSGLTWSSTSAGMQGQTAWSSVGGAVTPHNHYMTIQSNGGGTYVVCRPSDIDPVTSSCPQTSRLPVISETFVHLWEPAFGGVAVGAATQVPTGS